MTERWRFACWHLIVMDGVYWILYRHFIQVCHGQNRSGFATELWRSGEERSAAHLAKQWIRQKMGHSQGGDSWTLATRRHEIDWWIREVWGWFLQTLRCLFSYLCILVILTLPKKQRSCSRRSFFPSPSTLSWGFPSRHSAPLRWEVRASWAQEPEHLESPRRSLRPWSFGRLVAGGRASKGGLGWKASKNPGLGEGKMN